MRKMKNRQYQKLEIAVEYLDLAASLWLKDINLFCAAHLAGAAEEIIGQYCRKKGIKARRDEWEEFGAKVKEGCGPLSTGLSGRKFADIVYAQKNSIKHMYPKDGDDIVTIDIKEEATRQIRGAYLNLEKLKYEELVSKSVNDVVEKTTIYIDTNS